MAQNGTKTNERPGTRAVLRHARFSAYKAREVLNLIRGLPVADAMDELNRCERDAGRPIAKLLASAVANAGANDGLPADELFVSACFADEGPTMRRFRPRARGRATRINKRTTHITIIVGRLSEDELSDRRERGGAPADAAAARARRVAASRAEEPTEDPADEVAEDDVVEAAPEGNADATETVTDDATDTPDDTDDTNDAAADSAEPADDSDDTDSKDDA
ncbi:MAG: 50S ribosomal protein L22 [Microthrixaceae bacterium]|nr:50S ribosomal protein L22 [Microthrixaceae bacterium]